MIWALKLHTSKIKGQSNITLVDLLGFLAFYSSQVFSNFEKMAIPWTRRANWIETRSGIMMEMVIVMMIVIVVVIVLESLFFKGR